MRLKPALHPWPHEAAAARALQRHLAHAPLTSLRRPCRFLLGIDCAFPRALAPRAVAAAVLWDAERKEVLLKRRHVAAVRFPYVTGLLAFREIPLFLPLLAAIHEHVDAILVDGQGIAHPKRLGAAAHLALWLAEPVPVVGVAKSRLVGSHAPVPDIAGASVPLVYRGNLVGGVLRSRGGCRPLYVSPGGYIDVAGALAITRLALAGHRLPEPLHMADRLTKHAPFAIDRLQSLSTLSLP